MESDGVLSAQATCCELICAHLDPPWGGECLTRLALAREAGSLGENPDTRRRALGMGLGANGGNGQARVLLHVRPAAPRDAAGSGQDPELAGLRIHALGRLRVETATGRLTTSGCNSAPASSSSIGWPTRPPGGERADRGRPLARCVHRDALTVRQYVHQLRESASSPAAGPDRAHRSSARAAGVRPRGTSGGCGRVRRSGRAGCGLADSTLSRARFELDMAHRLGRGLPWPMIRTPMGARRA